MSFLKMLFHRLVFNHKELEGGHHDGQLLGRAASVNHQLPQANHSMPKLIWYLHHWASCLDRLGNSNSKQMIHRKAASKESDPKVRHRSIYSIIVYHLGGYDRRITSSRSAFVIYQIPGLGYTETPLLKFPFLNTYAQVRHGSTWL